MRNLNPYYDGKQDIENDIFAYIDETGDEGFVNSPNSWFGVSAIVLTQNTGNEMMDAIYNFFNASRVKSFKKLNHNRRKELLAKLRKYNYLTSHSFFNKPALNKISDKLCIYPSMYYVGIKNLIERISWMTQQLAKTRAHILISERNHIDFSKMSNYLFNTSVNTYNGGKNMYYKSKIGCVGVSNETKHPKLVLADYTASSMFQSLEEETEAKITENIYAELFLKGKLYSSTHSRYGGVFRNGIKLTPEDLEYIKYKGILEEGSHIL